jgi:hypothetical protein
MGRKTPSVVDPKKAVKVPIPGKDKVIENNDRMTIVGHVHHQSFGRSAKSVPMRYERLLGQSYEPVMHRMVVSAKDTKIESHWIKDRTHIGYVVIENKVGAGMLTRPTKEEQEIIEKQILLVRSVGSRKGWKVRPGMPFIAEPEDLDEIVLRAADQPVDIQVSIFSN